MTTSAERIQQLLADREALRIQVTRLTAFAEEIFEHFEYDKRWSQCPFCLWTPGLSKEGHHDCELERYAANRGDE